MTDVEVVEIVERLVYSMVAPITDTLHPKDPQYKVKRDLQVNEYLRTMTPDQINRSLIHQASQPVSREKREEQSELTRHVLGEMFDMGLRDQLVQKSILDSTGSGTSGGSVQIRQDLEAPLIALYVEQFPAWERIQHGQANGLVHTL